MTTQEILASFRSVDTTINAHIEGHVEIAPGYFAVAYGNHRTILYGPDEDGDETIAYMGRWLDGREYLINPAGDLGMEILQQLAN